MFVSSRFPRTGCNSREPKGKVSGLRPRPVLQSQWADIIVVEPRIFSMDVLRTLDDETAL